MILSAVLLVLSTFLDATIQFPAGDWRISLDLSRLFLFFIGFRRDFWEILAMCLLYVVVSHPFTGLSPMVVFLAHFPALLIAYRLRENLFTEAYLTHSLWVACFSFLIQILLYSSVRGIGVLEALMDYGLSSAVLAGVAAILTIPIFIFLDRIYDFFSPRSLRSEDLFG